MTVKLDQALAKYGRPEPAPVGERPEGCWCSGEGGRDLNWHIPGADPNAPPTPRFRNYCDCPDGIAARKAATEAEAAYQERKLQAAIEAGINRAEIPPKYRFGCTLETYPVSPANKAAVALIADWARRDPDVTHPDDLPAEQRAALSDEEWTAADKAYDAAFDDWRKRGLGSEAIFIHGPVGTGKTGLAASIIKRRIEVDSDARNLGALFRSVPALLDATRRSFDDHTDDPFEIAKRAHLLALDDIGAEKVTDWVAERLFVLIDHRYSHELPTIFTSNLSLVELGKHIGVRAASRIGEMALPVELKGANLRVRRETTTKE